jgi:hypothetical protein
MQQTVPTFSLSLAKHQFLKLLFCFKNSSHLVTFVKYGMTFSKPNGSCGVAGGGG